MPREHPWGENMATGRYAPSSRHAVLNDRFRRIAVVRREATLCELSAGADMIVDALRRYAEARADFPCCFASMIGGFQFGPLLGRQLRARGFRLTRFRPHLASRVGEDFVCVRIHRGV